MPTCPFTPVGQSATVLSQGPDGAADLRAHAVAQVLSAHHYPARVMAWPEQDYDGSRMTAIARDAHIAGYDTLITLVPRWQDALYAAKMFARGAGGQLVTWIHADQTPDEPPILRMEGRNLVLRFGVAPAPRWTGESWDLLLTELGLTSPFQIPPVELPDRLPWQADAAELAIPRPDIVELRGAIDDLMHTERSEPGPDMHIAGRTIPMSQDTPRRITQILWREHQTILDAEHDGRCGHCQGTGRGSASGAYTHILCWYPKLGLDYEEDPLEAGWWLCQADTWPAWGRGEYRLDAPQDASPDDLRVQAEALLGDGREIIALRPRVYGAKWTVWGKEANPLPAADAESHPLYEIITGNPLPVTDSPRQPPRPAS